MNKVITISREFGSGGHEIGEKLAASLNIPFYDNSLSEVAASNIGIDVDKISGIDETAAKSFLYSLVMGNNFMGNITTDVTTLTSQDRLFAEQSRLIEEYARKGPCVIVGRCSDYVLREHPNCMNIFICGSSMVRTQRIMSKLSKNESSASALVKKTDKTRESYYQYYTNKKWGIPTSYDLCINTDRIGIDKSVNLILKILAE
ncbi:MAG: cytidylate kinase-like family protein [Oscillospiraceae bacterium]